MNEQIITNLYELWRHIGTLTNKLIETNVCSAVSIDGTDWPIRIFDFKNDKDTINEILKLSRAGKLPDILTIAKPNDLQSHPDFRFLSRQKNMALDLKTITDKIIVHPNIQRVETEQDSIDFAKTASESFGYHVDYSVVNEIVKSSATARLFVYRENNVCLGCGIVFFDSNNNAGLHMIGTIPEGRGRGVGRSITERLLFEAKEAGKKICVLHASTMGEPIYKKLGFESFGEIEAYKILKSVSD